MVLELPVCVCGDILPAVCVCAWHRWTRETKGGHPRNGEDPKRGLPTTRAQSAHPFGRCYQEMYVTVDVACWHFAHSSGRAARCTARHSVVSRASASEALSLPFPLVSSRKNRIPLFSRGDLKKTVSLQDQVSFFVWEFEWAVYLEVALLVGVVWDC